MRPGALDQRVTIQSVTEADDGYGGRTRTWADVATVWARVVPVSGRERTEAMQVQSPALYRVTMRRRTDLTPDKRLVWQGRPMNVRFDGFNSPRDLYLTVDAELDVAS